MEFINIIEANLVILQYSLYNKISSLVARRSKLTMTIRYFDIILRLSCLCHHQNFFIVLGKQK